MTPAPRPIDYITGPSVFGPVPDGCSEIFAGCNDPLCERPCGARRSISEINLDIARSSQQIGFWTLAGVFLAIGVIITGAAAYGLPKAERQYQFDRRV